MAKKTTDAGGLWRQKRAGRDSDQFMVRLPDGMRKHLADVAERNGRSMNAEIVTALSEYFANEARSRPSADHAFVAALGGQQGIAQLIAAPKNLESALKDFEARLDRKLAERTEELAQLIKERK